MSEPNKNWRVNQMGMNQCCYQSLQLEIYRRKGLKESLMNFGDSIKCETCSSELICAIGESGKLRWAVPPG